MISKDELISRCSKLGKSITPQRINIAEKLSNAKGSITAYDLLDRLNVEGYSFNISTIYRVLDFWIDVGVVHKIESNNTYVACNDVHRNHFHVLLHCTGCDSIEESCQSSQQLHVENIQDFLPNKSQVIELQGLCTHCG